jgi:hypothetical protein
MDEVFVRIGGRKRYPWRALDQDGAVIDVLLQERRNVPVHAAVSNLLKLGRDLMAAGHYRTSRRSAFASWDRAAAV